MSSDGLVLARHEERERLLDLADQYPQGRGCQPHLLLQQHKEARVELPQFG